MNFILQFVILSLFGANFANSKLLNGLNGTIYNLKADLTPKKGSIPFPGNSFLTFIGEIGSKRFYLQHSLQINWFQSWELCRLHNMQLASIESHYEDKLLENFMKRNEIESAFISGNDLGRRTNNGNNRIFIWMSNGRRLSFINFNPGEPNGPENENCLEYCKRGDNYGWNDVNCSHERYCICELTCSNNCS